MIAKGFIITNLCKISDTEKRINTTSEMDRVGQWGRFWKIYPVFEEATKKLEAILVIYDHNLALLIKFYSLLILDQCTWLHLKLWSIFFLVHGLALPSCQLPSSLCESYPILGILLRITLSLFLFPTSSMCFVISLLLTS